MGTIGDVYRRGKESDEKLSVITAERDRLRSALKALEWNEVGISGQKSINAGWADVGRCPYCYHFKHTHAHSCIVALALKKYA